MPNNKTNTLLSVLSITIKCVAIILVLILICIQIRDFSAPDKKSNSPDDLPTINSGLACDLEDKCKEAMIFVGKMTKRTTEALRHRLADINNKELLCFLSGGGDASAMLDITRIIRENKISVCMADKYIIKGKDRNTSLANTFCASACGFVLIASHDRIYIGKNPKIGVHKPSTSLDLCLCSIPLWFNGYDAYSSIKSIINEEDDLKRKSKITQYHEISLKTESSEIHFLSKSELDKLKVFSNSSY
jgi:hypothetical protein